MHGVLTRRVFEVAEFGSVQVVKTSAEGSPPSCSQPPPYLVPYLLESTLL